MRHFTTVRVDLYYFMGFYFILFSNNPSNLTPVPAMQNLGEQACLVHPGSLSRSQGQGSPTLSLKHPLSNNILCQPCLNWQCLENSGRTDVRDSERNHAQRFSRRSHCIKRFTTVTGKNRNSIIIILQSFNTDSARGSGSENERPWTAEADKSRGHFCDRCLVDWHSMSLFAVCCGLSQTHNLNLCHDGSNRS